MKGRRIRTAGRRAGAAIAAIALLGSCATAPPGQESGLSVVVAPEPVPPVQPVPPVAVNAAPDGNAVHRSSVAGFVDALVQLPGFAPLDTTFAFERRALAADPFLQVLEEELATRGYGLRVSTTLGSRSGVGHVAERHEDGETTRTVSFGEAQMRRRFAQRADGEWVPTSSLFIRGADASRVTLDGRGEPPPVRPLPRNVADTGRSNYAGVFEDYADVEELILVFPNDSMVLGVDNKRTIQEAVARFDTQRDLFSLIGCSFGSTAIDNGNEVLATGRADRVKEALILAGVPGERVLDEGCWAGAPAENFPGRGVVLTVKRPLATLE